MIGISACLGGVCCRYDGQAKEITALKKLVENGQAMLVCPEVMGGLPIPREPAEISGGDGFDVWENKAKVITNTGDDVTNLFKQGAITAYQKLIENDIKTIILKEKSPSCGSLGIYDGTFSGNHRKGPGVATAYFLSKGLKVISENEWRTVVEHEE
ncbi:hypothetical protein UAY_01637 [Enterococcus moraviensis ATCC BAA-383]|uniref:Uncharacterized protein n=1 Tax=Enterococcus moraviensis ATCC BAA-383 TaxID=1158609 RepID=R2T6B0_9ENTE|nr:DUF523 domain-containing protein [Enterococcus moraviensis]EOI00534.1 hypothetical protein UAY_01637 [Enterococcus moraviensis ATCC BAA-383]EOT73237.1 hypothetical protein I586_00230 [Enterococcus moraviensis ATCC BAA-383]OJG68793.1 hypothetical protein RV09_GL000192 [Enterococcus moraviensis]